MKKLLLLVAVITLGKLVTAQNIQMHYDFGKDREFITTTVEMFKPDKYGSTFFFVDMDYKDDAVQLAYWEIARSFKWSETQKLEPRVEFNSGTVLGWPINNAYLVGAQYTWNTADFSKVFTLQANYKAIKGKDNGFQITGVWGIHMLDNKLSFTGFADFWKEDNMVFDDKGNMSETEFVFLTEPQIWYNVCKNFSFGGEVEISSNFAGNEGVMVNPTLAIKWTL